MKNKFYITTPIYYVNAEPHIGHTYTTVASDVLARFHRLNGEVTYFSTGTDEHGTKIQQKADEAGKEPQVFADEIATKFELAWDELSISNNGFLRTTKPAHKKSVQNALQYMYDKGDIYLDKYEGLYCTGCEQFKNEKDLLDGKCPDHQTAPERMSEETYVFKMSKYGGRLRDLIEKDELEIKPIEKKNEILSFYKDGLKDVSFSRKNVKWGIPLPWDESHTAYVWSDAFLNYLTVLGWDGEGGKFPPEYTDTQMWPAELQLMSKDILRVHASIWPAMLLSLDLPVQKKIFVHGFFLIDGQKMSKSIGNVIAPRDLVERYGVDATRYLLMSATTFGRDGDISFDKFDDKFNADLANGLGNLLSRTVAMTLKLRKNEGELIKGADRFGIEKSILDYNDQFLNIELDKALATPFSLAERSDQLISETEVFRMIGSENEKAGEILYHCLETLRIIAFLIYPFMPDTSDKIISRLGLNFIEALGSSFEENIKFGQLKTDTQIEKGEPLFPRLN